MTDDTEHQLRDLLQRRADRIDERAITGDSVRLHAAGHDARRSRAWAPLAAAAAVVTLIGGIAVTSLGSSPTRSGPTPAAPGAPGSLVSSVSSSSSSTGGSGFGNVPKCPATTHAPGNPNTVCAIGPAPSMGPGLKIVRISGH